MRVANILQLGVFQLMSLYSTTIFAGDVDVINATVQRTGENTYAFSATLKHGDTGWDHYANQWVVTDENGHIYGTRVLHHPHVNEQPFTRNLSGVYIPKSVEHVIIKASDSVHGSQGKTFNIALPR